MVTDLIPHEVDLNSAGADFWRRYHEFRRVRHAETRPDDPILPDDVERNRLLASLKYEINDCFEVVRDGEMVGWLRTAVTRPGAPGYEENRLFLWCYGSVLAPYRRQGIGRRWLLLVLDVMDRHGCTFVTLESEEDSGHAFLKWLGAPLKAQGAENRLRLGNVDWAMVRRWIEEGEKRNPDTALERYDDHIPDAMLDEYAPQLGALLNTMPWDDLEHGPIVVTPEMLRHDYERMDAAGIRHYTVLTRESDGVISGITDMTWGPHRVKMLVQLFTGVLPSARGRGIGKWIKAAMLERMHQMYPDAEWVTTGNADSNGPMLAINQRLGFKRHRWGAEYQLGRDELAARLETLKVRA
jgi:GNAT superfamily N-acetyltransferase